MSSQLSFGWSMVHKKSSSIIDNLALGLMLAENHLPNNTEWNLGPCVGTYIKQSSLCLSYCITFKFNQHTCEPSVLSRQLLLHSQLVDILHNLFMCLIDETHSMKCICSQRTKRTYIHKFFLSHKYVFFYGRHNITCAAPSYQ